MLFSNPYIISSDKTLYLLSNEFGYKFDDYRLIGFNYSQGWNCPEVVTNAKGGEIFRLDYPLPAEIDFRATATQVDAFAPDNNEKIFADLIKQKLSILELLKLVRLKNKERSNLCH